MNITINGYNINYKITGPESAEKTAVILQGWGTGMDLYDFAAGCINDGYRVVQFDFPGFGESDEPREPWRPADYADFFCRFMEALDIHEAVLIGHSYGSRVIIKLAGRSDLPFTISKLVIIDGAGIMPERSAAQKRKVKRYKMMRNFLTSKPVHAMFPEVIDYWMSQQGSDDYRNSSPMMKKCLVMAVNEDQRAELPAIKQDTLLIWGDLDDATPISDAKIMEEMIPEAALVVLEGTGHYSFLEKPQQFRSVIRYYLGVDAEAAKVAESADRPLDEEAAAASSDPDEQKIAAGNESGSESANPAAGSGSAQNEAGGEK
jgi:pimeloyl-ACP methyl ester carboxylesterase